MTERIESPESRGLNLSRQKHSCASSSSSSALSSSASSTRQSSTMQYCLSHGDSQTASSLVRLVEETTAPAVQQTKCVHRLFESTCIMHSSRASPTVS
eukprot:CAMPEP_0119359978 /NCGR_PEP_ID=MMETSP1334-20130426/7726_1 /TAXON_ID=127549 /ORGANISM="Calcidiscus leptoporus, Strain RCC1130" /LENGTH=97 /DNA_ID=CAMNT_0007374737 /DNA_START=564 /DNA_END=854 /DNA_ORIENTATION=-